MPARLKPATIHPGSPDAGKCPVRDVLDRIGDRWSLLVLLTLSGGTMRFTVLKNAVGDISQRMLAQTLRTLEQDGLVSRKAYPSIPPKVEYTLTPLGVSLLKKLLPLIEWAETHHAEIREARTSYRPPMSAD